MQARKLMKRVALLYVSSQQELESCATGVEPVDRWSYRPSITFLDERKWVGAVNLTAQKLLKRCCGDKSVHCRNSKLADSTQQHTQNIWQFSSHSSHHYPTSHTLISIFFSYFPNTPDSPKSNFPRPTTPPTSSPQIPTTTHRTWPFFWTLVMSYLLS